MFQLQAVVVYIQEGVREGAVVESSTEIDTTALAVS